MRRGTTPDYILTVAGYDLTEQSIYVTVQQYAKTLNLNGERIAVEYDGQTQVSSVTFSLTQEETLQFRSGKADVQIRFIDEYGFAQATDIGTIIVSPVLNEDVIEYGGGTGD